MSEHLGFWTDYLESPAAASAADELVRIIREKDCCPFGKLQKIVGNASMNELRKRPKIYAKLMDPTCKEKFIFFCYK